jgi:hypothetical protein
MERKVEDYMSKSVPKWPFMPITGNSGKKAYFRFRSSEYTEDQVRKSSFTFSQ